MKTIVTKGISLSLMSLVLASSQCAARAEEVKVCEKPKNEGAMVYKVTDVAVVRPVAAGLSLVGGALFLISWPVTAASGDSDETYRMLVRKPSNIAFNRKEGRNDTLPKGTKIMKSPRSQ
ncbi:MAG: hypothetical protein JWM68_3802 [Verrucomicrobiales bacterium]|nr:hypothetical protein [Verrucomicrobiales bacterium]